MFLVKTDIICSPMFPSAHLVFDQMEVTYSTLLHRDVPHSFRDCTIGFTSSFAKDSNKEAPENWHAIPPPFSFAPVS